MITKTASTPRSDAFRERVQRAYNEQRHVHNAELVRRTGFVSGAQR